MPKRHREKSAQLTGDSDQQKAVQVPPIKKRKTCEDEENIQKAEKKQTYSVEILCERGNIYNQDAYFVMPNMVGVLDGHGSLGHNLVTEIVSFFDQTKLQNTPAELMMDELVSHLKEAKETKHLMTFNGSTLVAIRQHPEHQDDPKHFQIIQVGDSRCLRVFKNEKDEIDIEWLTIDHDLTSPEEHKRVIDSENGTIIARRGRSKTLCYLGLKIDGEYSVNMSRAIGDEHLIPGGLLHTPSTYDFIQHEEKDICLILMSDGISDVLTDDEIREQLQSSLTLPSIYEKVKELTYERSGRLDDATMVKLKWI